MPTLTIPGQEPVTFAVVDLGDNQVAGLLSAAVTARWGTSACLQVVNRAQGTLTFDKYAMIDGYRDWGTAPQLQQATFTIGDNYAVVLGEPTPVMPITTYEPVGTEVGGTDADACFSLIDGEEGEPLRARFSVTSEGRYVRDGFAVYPQSLLFKAGDYPDKQFSMTPAQLEAAAGVINGSPEPIAGNIQHTQFLLGKAAFVDKAWTTDGGQTLRGVVRVPLGLDELMTDGDKGISMEWNRADRVAEGFALCTNPRVPEAALMALDAPRLTSMTDEAIAAEIAKPSFLERLKALFNTGNVQIATPATEVIPPSISAETLRLRAELAKSQAELFVSDELRAGRCTPAERDGLVASFVQAYQDDLATPTTVTFSEGQGVTRTGNRVEALRARQSQRPAHNLTDEVVQSAVLLTGDPANDNPNATAKFASLDTVYERRAAATQGDAKKGQA